MRSKLEVTGYALAILSIVGVGASALGNAREMSVKQDYELDSVINLIVAESLNKRDEDRREGLNTVPGQTPAVASTTGSATRDVARDTVEQPQAPNASHDRLALNSGVPAAGETQTPPSGTPSLTATTGPAKSEATGSASPQPATTRRTLSMQTDVTAGAAAGSEERKAKATVLARKSTSRRARNQKSRTHFLPLDLTMLPKFTTYTLLGLR